MKAYKKNLKDKLIVITILSVIGIILGLIGANIPIIHNQWINYIGYPILQMILIIIISLSLSKKENDEKNDIEESIE